MVAIFLLIGVAIGFGAAATVLGFLYFKLTLPSSVPAIIDENAFSSDNHHASSTHRDVTCQGATMPHSFTVGGCYKGVLYTATGSQWNRANCVVDWPPAPPCLPWKASVEQGTLVLTPLPLFYRKQGRKDNRSKRRTNRDAEAPHVDRTPVGQDSSIEGEHAALPHIDTKLGIPLEGCTIELVRDGLQGRSEMVRRAPLLLTHPTWPLFRGENALFIFATDPAAKQEWLKSLIYWCQGGHPMRAVDSTYASFNLAMKQRTLTPFVTEDQQPSANNIDNGTESISPRVINAGMSPQPGKRRGWRSWRRSGKDLGTATGEIRENNARSVRVTATAVRGNISPPDIDSLMEARWMQSRKVPVPDVSPNKKPDDATVKNGHRNNNSIEINPAGFKGSPAKSITTGPLLASSEPQIEQELHQAHLPGGASSDEHSIPTEESEFSDEHHSISHGSPRPAGLMTARDDIDDVAHSYALPDELPSPLLPLDHFVNEFVARSCFDLLRNPAFAEHVRARIQRQLSRLHTPDFVHSLEVIMVEPGATAPSVSRFAALPAPRETILPQVLFDFSYRGTFTVTIGCKVDVRDAPAWAAVEKAIRRIEGRQRHHTHDDGNNLGKSPSRGSLGGISSEWDDGDDEEGRLLHAVGENSGDQPEAGEEGVDEESEHRPRRGLIGGIRHGAAQRLRKFADSAASQIYNMPLRVSLTFEVLEGSICAWIPPPPGNRLFWSFLAPPRMVIKSKPQLGGRILKYAYHASRASAWIQARMELAFRRNMVFPCGGDIPLPLLLPIWDPRAMDGLIGLREAIMTGVRKAGSGRQRRRSRKSSNQDEVTGSRRASPRKEILRGVDTQ